VTTVSCSQCGLPVPGAVEPDGATVGPLFCCPGCAAVFGLLHTGAASGPAAGAAFGAVVVRFAVSAFLAMNIMVLSWALYGDWLYGAELGRLPDAIRNFLRWMILALSLPAVWLMAAPLVRGILASRGGLNRAFHALVLTSVGASLGVSVVAVLLGRGEIFFDTATMLLLLVTLGRLLEGWLRTRATRLMQELLESSERHWTVVRGGESMEVAPAELRAGDTLQLRPGDRVPVAARVVEGSSEVSAECRDGSLLPQARTVGAMLHSGEQVLANPLVVELTADGGENAFWPRYCRAARAALENRAPAERLADRVSSALLGITITLAFATLGFWWWHTGDLAAALLPAISVMVVACPCAMGLATPVALRLATTHAAQLGVLVGKPEILEQLACVDHVVLDHTGTMTARRLEVASVVGPGGEPFELPTQATLDAWCALAEGSRHPVADAVARWARAQGGDPTRAALVDVTHHMAEGLAARDAAGQLLLVGAPALFRRYNVALAPMGGGADVYVAVAGTLAAALTLDSPVHPATASSIAALLDAGYGVSLRTGATRRPGLPEELLRRCAAVETRQRPEDKAAAITALRAQGRRVAMVGDGLNDIPALLAADVAIAVGDPEALVGGQADVVLPGEGMGALPGLMELARRTRRVVRTNFVYVVSYNTIALALAAAGMLAPLPAVGLMILSSTGIVLRGLSLAKPGSFAREEAGGPGEAGPLRR